MRGVHTCSRDDGSHLCHRPGAERPALTSAEEVLQLLEEGLLLGLRVFSKLLRESFDELALLVGEHGRNLHLHLDELIAARRPRTLRDSFGLHAEDVAWLGSRGDAELAPAIEGRDVDLSAKGRLREGDGNLAGDVVANPSEKRVRCDTDRDFEIAGALVRAGSISGIRYELCLLYTSPSPRD